MKNAGVKIVPCGWLVHGFVAEVVGHPIGDTRFEARAGKPNGETVLVVVATGTDNVRRRLRERRSPELSSEKHKSIVEHAASTKISQKSGDRPIDARSLSAVVLAHVLMPIPIDPRGSERAAGEQLDEANAPLQQSSAQ